jgi:hypothetical protein
VARWWRLNTTNTTAVSQADAGNITGEDIAAGTHTFYPCVMVDVDGNMAVNFSASGTSVYASAYYTTRLAGDAPGSTSLPKALASGLDFYKRYNGGANNRWGNYNGIALSPDNSELWIFNEYAGLRGSVVGNDDGRWLTRLGRFRIKTVTAVQMASPRGMLEQNLPNPFNPLTTIRFVLPTASHATLEIVDVAGRHIRTLVDQSLAKGDHQVVWDGRDNHGNRVASGVYLYRLHSDGLDQSRKMVLLK